MTALNKPHISKVSQEAEIKGFAIAITVPQPSFFESLLTTGHTKNLTESIFGGFKSTPALSPHTLCPLSCVLSYQIKP